MKRERPWGPMLGVLAAVVVGPVLTTAGWNEVRAERNIQANGRLVAATVTEGRTMISRGVEQFDLRYTFTVPGQPIPYTHRDVFPFRRENLWSTLPEAEWRTALAAGTVDVVYDLDNPWHNRPASALGKMVDVWALCLLGAGITLAGVAGGAVTAWRWISSGGSQPDVLASVDDLPR